MGAWIEIVRMGINPVTGYAVAPPVGAWIEISRKKDLNGIYESLPPWERGLKLDSVFVLIGGDGRSPRGSVD